MRILTPKEIVDELERYIIGQHKAKRAMAVALRNRYRRAQLDPELRDEVTPKNILMIGPTGVGKTEIARRLARLIDAPFVKVEATKFTEVGYVGRDVESIVRDLVEASIRQEKEKALAGLQDAAEREANEQLIDLLAHEGKKQRAPTTLESFLGMSPPPPESSEEDKVRIAAKKRDIRDQLEKGLLEEAIVAIWVDDSPVGGQQALPGTDMNMQDVLGSVLPPKKKERHVRVREARKILTAQEAAKLLDMDAVIQTAVVNAEENGIVFIDEIDKIAGRSAQGSGPDVSREGVQRDILPIVEGSTVITKYGPIKTDYMLFIAAGAFHIASVSDLIPELQGRFPVRVELSPLTEEDLERILTQPENALLKQYQALLAVDHITLRLTDDGRKSIAKIAHSMNENLENIGARRLHTVLESLLEDISFHADGSFPDTEVVIDATYVKQQMGNEVQEHDVGKYIL